MADVAVVIPVRGDLAPLEALLARISGWSTRPEEIVVIATGRDTALEDLCGRYGCALLLRAANRGAQLDDGARHARAATLWFLHADAWPPVEGVELVATAVAAGAAAGCFRFRFQGEPTWTKRLLAWLVRVRVSLGGIAYGDQGLFADRSAYLAAGGFPHEPLFEEVRLVRRLRRHGRFRVLPTPILVSTRRWDRDGWWRRSVQNRWLALCYMLGVSPQRLSRHYHKGMEPTARTDS